MVNGTSNTILIGEVAGNPKPWGYPTNWRDPLLGVNRTPDGFGHPAGGRGVQFAFADGSVRTFADDTSPEVLAPLAGGPER
jgi:prepilin-type processing-associated H-X9-DG protein